MRAINVGKRRVKMDALRSHVDALGFTDAATLIASGNVAFTDPLGRSSTEVGEIFDSGLSKALGFDVVSALRTQDEVEAMIDARPFGSPGDPGTDWTDDDVVHVSFLLADPPPEAAERLALLESEVDRFCLVGREVFWRRRGKLTDSAIEPKVLSRAIGVESTARRLDTVVKMSPLLRH